MTELSLHDASLTIDVPLTISAGWRRSSRCSNGGCVEVAQLAAGTVGVRDSKRADSPMLTYDRAEWIAFVAGVKAGEFDLPEM